MEAFFILFALATAQPINVVTDISFSRFPAFLAEVLYNIT